jgi:hypothetical protein
MREITDGHRLLTENMALTLNVALARIAELETENAPLRLAAR